MNNITDNLTLLLNNLHISTDYDSNENPLNAIMIETAKCFGFEIASIFLLDKGKNKLWSIASSDFEDIKIDSRLGICGEIVRTKESVIVNDAYEDSRFYPKVDQRTGYKTNSLLAVPLFDRNQEIIGTFQLINKKEGNIHRKDKELSEYISTEISNFMANNTKMLESREIQDNKSNNTNILKSNFSTKNIIGFSDKIQNIIRIIEQVSDTPINVLISGESGTGKELVARAIHYSSNKSEKPFVAVNCAAIPESLLESELFGVEKGVATGVDSRTGKFEQANGGTLFLDEIGDLSLSSQAKILRVLQDSSIQKVGSSKPVNLEIRIISATNKDLTKEIANGNFREDLYYRLNVVQIKTPSLKEIPEDIILLAEFFLNKYCSQYNKEPKKLSRTASNLLQQYSWPGNVRELENLIKKLITLVPSKTIKEEHIPDYIVKENYISELIDNGKDKTLKSMVEELEKRLIIETLEKNDNNKLQTAKDLGISRQGLLNKIKQYGLES